MISDLDLGAEFVGLALVLVYVGAVAILVMFAILLTRSGEPAPGPRFSSAAFFGAAIAVAVFAVLAKVMTSSGAVEASSVATADASSANVAAIGGLLMSDYVLPLEVLALLLTAAMIGAVVIALREKEGAK